MRVHGRCVGRRHKRWLNAEKRQMTIQMQVEKVKKNKLMEQVYSDAIKEIKQKVAEEEALLNQTVTTPQKSNRSPSL